MKTWTFAILVSALIVMAAPQGEDGSPPMEFDTYWMVFLERGEKRADYTEEQRASIQTKHLAHLSAMKKQGYMLVAGPLEVAPDEKMRGLCLYRSDLEQEEVKKLASQDPAVAAGVLSVRVIKWWMPKGGLSFAAEK